MKGRVKKIIFFAILHVFVFSAKGQIIMGLLFGDKLNSDDLSFGLHIDHSWNKLSGVGDAKSLTALNLGLFFTYHFNERWHGNLEMLAKYKRGTDEFPVYDLQNTTLNNQFMNGKVERSINYLSIPISIQYLTPAGFYAELGPQISIRAKARDIFSADLPEGELQLEIDIRDDINRWDFGWLGGIGYRIGKSKLICLGARYYGGFSDVVKTWEGKQQNRQWGIYCNFPMGKAKSGKSNNNKE